jgi:hypothetical protein
MRNSYWLDRALEGFSQQLVCSLVRYHCSLLHESREEKRATSGCSPILWPIFFLDGGEDRENWDRHDISGMRSQMATPCHDRLRKTASLPKWSFTSLPSPCSPLASTLEKLPRYAAQIRQNKGKIAVYSRRGNPTNKDGRTPSRLAPDLTERKNHSNVHHSSEPAHGSRRRVTQE